MEAIAWAIVFASCVMSKPHSDAGAGVLAFIGMLSLMAIVSLTVLSWLTT